MNKTLENNKLIKKKQPIAAVISDFLATTCQRSSYHVELTRCPITQKAIKHE